MGKLQKRPDLINLVIKTSGGMDLGINPDLYLSTGERGENPRFLRTAATKLAKLQRKLSQCKKGSKPWEIIKGRIAKLHQVIARTRALLKGSVG